MSENNLHPDRHQQSMVAFGNLCRIMDELREQCPWDQKQTYLSLRNLTIEETYELADALLEENPVEIKEELGDLLLHMVFYARIGEEQGHFNMCQILEGIAAKLIERHPHIYGDVKVRNEEDVKQNWERIKLKTGKRSVLGGVPQSLPAMIKAYRMQEKTAQVGFEWKETDQVLAKVHEELEELQEAITNKEPGSRIEEEFGDVLFSLINYARFINVDPETALERVNKKFKSRFEYIEDQAGLKLTSMSLEEMDALWEEAKHLERKG